MNRRDALKLLGGLPLLAFLKPEAVEVKAKRKGKIFWSWEARQLEDREVNVLIAKAPEQGSNWIEAEGDRTLTIGPDGVVYVGGAFTSFNGKRIDISGESFNTLK